MGFWIQVSCCESSCDKGARTSGRGGLAVPLGFRALGLWFRGLGLRSLGV